jgi:hypothetical protein
VPWKRISSSRWPTVVTNKPTSEEEIEETTTEVEEREMNMVAVASRDLRLAPVRHYKTWSSRALRGNWIASSSSP